VQAEAEVYDGPIVEAVEHFQRRHGLIVDGIIGKKTFQRLNTPVSERVKQIELTLERYRWLPDDLGHRPIVVNVPGFELRAYDRESDESLRNALSMNVIVGEAYPRHQTPLFRGRLKHVVFGPYWNVPYSILRRELYPKIAWDPEFIPMNGYEIVSRFSPNATPLPITEGNIERLLSGEVKLRQRPGRQNALGEVKFLFPNRHSVYLHGTPAKRLFSRDQRDFSHGCIRVQDPAALAEYVLKQEGWSRDRVDRTIARGKWKQVNLSQPIDVYVLYGTAVADPNAGTVYFYNDIYGHDSKLEKALAAVHR
jgi:murein L,D-transpeptidase YcbB/YkuD